MLPDSAASNLQSNDGIQGLAKNLLYDIYISLFLHHCFLVLYVSLPCDLLISSSGAQSLGVIERKSTRVLSTTDEEGLSQNENPIKEVTDNTRVDLRSVTDPIGLPNIISGNPNSTSEKNSELDPV